MKTKQRFKLTTNSPSNKYRGHWRNCDACGGKQYYERRDYQIEDTDNGNTYVVHFRKVCVEFAIFKMLEGIEP